MAINKKGIFLSILLLSMLNITAYAGSTTNLNKKPAIQYSEPKASSGWYNISSSLTSSIPVVNINFSRNGVNKTFTMEQIVNYTSYENQTFPMVNYTIEKDGSYFEIIGFDPLFLMEIAGWSDVLNFTVTAKDGYSKQVNITQLLLADDEYVKYTDTDNQTIIIIIWNGQWLADSNVVDYGDFYLYGENLAGNQKVKNITTISYDDPWTVKIIIDGIEELSISSANGTTSNVGNYTTYTWGYFDNDSGFGWDERECTGFTIASLLDHSSLENKNYEISFISYDGYGENKVFTKTHIEDGYTGYMINDPQEELSNEGKQTILMSQQDGEDLGYNRGPYQVIIPGLDKGNYIGGIVEIRISTNVTEDETGDGISGFSIGFFAMTFCITIIAIINKRRT